MCRICFVLRFVVAATAILLIAGAARPSLSDPDDVTEVSTILVHEGEIVVSGTVNGKPARFALDTGSSTTVLTPEAAHRLGLTVSNEKVEGLGFGGGVSARKAGTATVGIGGCTVDNDDIYVIPFPGDLNDVDGLLGYTFFQKFIVSIDFEHRRMALGGDIDAVREALRTEFGPEAARKTAIPASDGRPGRELSLPLKLDDLSPVFDATFDGNRVRLMIDTGDNGGFTLYPTYVARRHLLGKYPHHIHGPAGQGLGGDVEADIVRVSALKLGADSNADAPMPVTLRGVVTMLCTQGGLPDSDAEDADGQIGVDVLKRFIMTLDYPHQRLILQPNRHLDDPFIYDSIGFELKPDHGKYVAADVAVGGAAARAGLANGDVILSMNGVPAAQAYAAEDNLYDVDAARTGSRLKIVRRRRGHAPDILTIVRQDLL